MDRLSLHEELCQLAGSRRVYFSPPENFKMEYDCIRYGLSNKPTLKADDRNYMIFNEYELTIIERHPDTDLANKIMNHFPSARWGRSYVSDNLSHKIIYITY